MAIEWDVLETFSKVHRKINGTVVEHIYGINTPNMTFFDSTLHEDDAIIFVNNGYFYDKGYGVSRSHSISSVKVNISEAVDGDYDYVWEYFSTSGWKPLQNVNDPSNGLRNIGEHLITWDMPNDWYIAGYSEVGTDWLGVGWAVRIRIYNVVGGNGGGKQGDAEIQGGNYAITIRDGNEYTIEDIYNSGLGFVDKLGERAYRMLNNLSIQNGTLILDKGIQLEVGSPDTKFMIMQWSNATMKIDNASLLWYSPTISGLPYNYWFGYLYMSNAAKLAKQYGGYTSGSIAGTIDIQDSQIFSIGSSSDNLLFNGTTKGSIKRTNMAMHAMYNYSAYIQLEDVAFRPVYPVNTNYFLNGSGTRYVWLQRSDLENRVGVYSTQRSNTIVLDCKNVNRNEFYLGSTYGNGTNYIWEQYTLKIKVVDENNNPIEGAKVEVYDKNGHTALIKDWYQTDYTRLYRVLDKDENYLEFQPSRPTYFDVGTVMMIRGEYMRITQTNGDCVYVDRHISYNGYDSLTVGGHSYYPPVKTEEPYILTNASGWARFSGANGEFDPRVSVYVKANNYDNTEVEREYGPTFTIRVSKPGFQTVSMKVDITEPKNMLMVMKKAQTIGMLDFNKTMLNLDPLDSNKYWMGL